VGADGLPRDPERLVYSRSDVEAGFANLELKPDDVVTVSEKDYFYIQAEVRKPGKYEIHPGLTLLQAIAVAEGLTDWADKTDIVVIRKQAGKESRQTLNLKKIERQKAPDMPLVAGDIIIVPRRIL
jgi:polysaccharide export outer membrane protein